MTDIPRVLFGDDGEGTFVVKCSTPGNDVRNLADDFDGQKRSFNSQWPNIAKIKLLGTASCGWTITYSQTLNMFAVGSTTYAQRGSVTSLVPVRIAVPTGLTYIPAWEERIYSSVNRYIYDDYCYASVAPVSGIQSALSGGRSYHSGPSTTPASTIFLEPFTNTYNNGQVQNIAWSAAYPAFGGSAPPWPPYPSVPIPGDPPASVYVVYSNKMGDVA